MQDKTPDELARRNLGKALLTALVDEIRATPDVWQKLSEAHQASVLDRLTARIEHEVGRAIVVLQSGELPSTKGTLESVTIKDGAKLVIKVGLLDSAMHDLIDANGQQVLVVLSDPSEFTKSAEEVEPDADQPALPLAGENPDAEDGPPEEPEDLDDAPSGLDATELAEEQRL